MSADPNAVVTSEPGASHPVQMDPSLSIFLDKDFDSNQFATHIITQDAAIASGDSKPSPSLDRSPVLKGRDTLSHMHNSSSVEQCVDALERRLGDIDDSIKKIVGQNYDQLMRRAEGTAKLRGSLRKVQQGITQVDTAALHVRQLVLQPLNQMKQRIKQLERIQAAGMLLRGMVRVHAISKKVSQHMESIQAATKVVNSAKSPSSSSSSRLLRELTKASLSISDIERLIGDPSHPTDSTSGTPSISRQASASPDTEERNSHHLSQLREVQDYHRPQTARHVAAVSATAHQLLIEGLRKFNQAQVGAALQVFFNLRRLPEAVERVLEQILQHSQDLTLSVFSASSLAKALAKAKRNQEKPATAAAPSNSKGAHPPLLSDGVRVVLSKRVNKVCDAIYAYSLQAWTLHRVLVRKRDPMTRESFIDVARPRIDHSDWNPTSQFWQKLTKQLQKSITKLSKNHETLRHFLTAEYPAVRKQLQSVLERLRQSTGEPSARTPGLTPLPQTADDRSRLLGCFDVHLQAYTAQSTQVLRNQLKEMFSRSKTTARGSKHAPLPEIVQISSLTSDMRRELRATQNDFGLCAVVLGSVRRIGDQFARAMEHARATEPSSLRVRLSAEIRTNGNGSRNLENLAGVGAKLTRAQVHNFDVVRKTAAFSDNLHEIIGSLNPTPSTESDSGDVDLIATAHNELEATFAALENVQHHILCPFFVAVLKEIEGVMMGMHDENFATDSQNTPSSSSTSLYMSRVKAAIAVCSDVYFRPLPSTKLAVSYLKQFVQGILALFTRHASLLKPLSEAGSLRVATDATELDMAVNSLAEAHGFRIDNAELQFLKQILFVETGAEILTNVVPTLRLGVDVRPSTVVHHLFSRASPHLQYPMQRTPHLDGSTSPNQHTGRSYVANYCRWIFDQSISHMGEGGQQPRNSRGKPRQQKGRDHNSTGVGSDGAGKHFDPLVNLTSIQSLRFEQNAFDKLQLCCDEFAQRVTASGAGNEKDLAFVNAIVQAGAEMLLKYQRVVETANRR